MFQSFPGDLWVWNESILEQIGVAIKVGATATDKTSKKVGNVSDKNVIDVGKNDLEDSPPLKDYTDIEVTSEDVW